MFDKIEEYPNTWACTTGAKFFFFGDGKVFSFPQNSIQISTSFGISKIDQLGTGKLVLSNNSQCSFFDLTSGEEAVLPMEVIANIYGQVFILNDHSIFPSELVCVDYSQLEKEVWRVQELVASHRLVTEECLFYVPVDSITFQNRNEIIVLSAVSGARIETLDFEAHFQGAMITGVIGYVQDVLILGFDHDMLVGVAKDGEIIWKYECNPFIGSLLKERILLLGERMVEICALTGVVFSDKPLPLDPDGNALRSNRNSFAVNENYVISTGEGSGTIFAIDRKSGVLIWFHQEKGKTFPAGKQFILFENYLVVQDDKDTLCVFEQNCPYPI